MTLEWLIESFWAILGGLGTGVLLVGALSSWLGKIWAERILSKDRAKYDRELESFRQKGDALLEKVRGKTEKEILVHKVQFEKEFEVYKSLWNALVILRDTTVSLRGVLEWDVPGESEPDRIKRKMVGFHPAYDSFLELVERNRPFYAEEIYAKVKELISNTHSEVISFLRVGREYRSQEELHQFYEIRKKIQALSDETCDLIRNRIGLIKIID